MDVCSLVTFFRFAFIGTTWRFMIACVAFYGFRVILQKIWYVQYPVGYNWGYPGIMSIFVPYGETADFFYSGHVGVCMLQFLEYNAIGWHYWSYFALATMCMQFTLMISLRSHYTVDMLSALIFAHYFFMIADTHSYVIDWYVFGQNKQNTFIANKTIEIKKSDPTNIIDPNQVYYLSCNNCIHLLTENKHNRLVAFPIIHNDRKCTHTRVTFLKEENSPPGSLNAGGCINESIIQQDILDETWNNSKPKEHIDEEMYSLLAARALIKK